MVDIGLAADLVDGRASVGGFVDYSHHISDMVSAFVRTEVGVLPATREVFASGRVGVRVTW